MNADRVIVLTGATDGLGRAVAHRLAAAASTTLILHGRDPDRLAAVVTELAEHPATKIPLCADLSVMSQVHGLSDHIADAVDHVNVLVNNAGVGFGEPDGDDRRLTADGNELRFAVNHLAPFALINDLTGLLHAGAPARVVNVASLGQAPVDFDDLTLDSGYSGWRAYRRSKMAMITAGFLFAEKLAPLGITVNSVHPATFMPTKMVLMAGRVSEDSLETGVTSVMRLIEDPDLEGVTGAFFDRQAEAIARSDAYDPAFRAALWAASQQLTSR